jgi:hypothetical protein
VGLFGIPDIWTILRTDCWSNKANEADVKLNIRLIIHIELTKMMDTGGEDDDRSLFGGVQVPFGGLGSCWEIWQRMFTVTWLLSGDNLL